MRFGERGPGPLGLTPPPPPEKLARLPYWAFHPLGVERRRADTIRAAAAVARRLEKIRGLSAAEGRRRVLAGPGVGPWRGGGARGARGGGPAPGARRPAPGPPSAAPRAALDRGDLARQPRRPRRGVQLRPLNGHTAAGCQGPRQ